MLQLQLLVITARNSARRCNAPYSIPNVLMDGVQLHLPPINFQYGAFGCRWSSHTPLKRPTDGYGPIIQLFPILIQTG
jgi:hypothetical protein